MQGLNLPLFLTRPYGTVGKQHLQNRDSAARLLTAVALKHELEHEAEIKEISEGRYR